MGAFHHPNPIQGLAIASSLSTIALWWLERPELRRRCHPGRNKSGQRHSLAQVFCVFKQGRIADPSAEAQQFRASGLNLVSAAIVFWNSTYRADAIAHLRAIGHPAPDVWLADSLASIISA